MCCGCQLVWATPTIWAQAFEGCVSNLVDLPLPCALTIQMPPPSQHPFVCPIPTGSLAQQRADRQGHNWQHVTVDLWVCFFLLFVFPSQPIWWKVKKYSVPSGESLRKLFPYQQDSIVDRWAANLLNLWLAGPLTRKTAFLIPASHSCQEQDHSGILCCSGEGNRRTTKPTSLSTPLIRHAGTPLSISHLTAQIRICTVVNS